MASWRAMVLRSLRQNSSITTRNYVQLATVKESGAPSNRTIVFRGFLGESDELTFVTDTRSCKAEEVKHNQMAELCWYFPISREQYRIAGQLKIIAHDHTEASLLEARQQAWQRLSDNGRLQFTWPPPGAKRESDAVFDGPAPPAEAPAPITFSLLVLSPSEVDYLSLRGNTRQKFERDAGGDSAMWTATSINP